MAQGTRGRWIRTAATGLGVLLCSGLVGCWNADKPRENGLFKKTGLVGLPGTPKLPENGAGTLGKTGQPAGTTGQVRTGTGMGAGTGTQPAGGFGNYPNYPAQPGNTGAIGAPTQPGFVPSVGPSSYQPTGASGTPGASLGGSTTGAGAYVSPPPPALSTVEPLPPGPPSYPTGAGVDPAGVQPLAPVGGPPMSPPGGYGK
jgi:hypothetical protein